MEQHYFDLQMSSWKSAFPLEYLAVKPPVLLRFAGIHVLCVILLPWNRENEKSSEALTISWANKDWEGWEQRLSAQSMAGSVRSSSSVTLAELWILPINQMRDKTIFLCCVFWVFLLCHQFLVVLFQLVVTKFLSGFQIPVFLFHGFCFFCVCSFVASL